MQVHVALLRDPYEGDLLLGVADSLEGARQLAARDGRKLTWGSDGIAYLPETELCYVIEETTLHTLAE